MNFQQMIFALNEYWAEQGCVILQPYDMEVGAGTFHPATFLAAIGPEPMRSAYVQPSRRPTDGRYGDNPNRLQHYFQYQVVLKPSPADFQQMYLDSIRAIDIDPLREDVRFVEDDWESPTLGAWGLGWEVWLNGMEITQVTYFQQAGGLECRPVTGEITYGLERIAMYVQGVDNVFDLDWNGQWSYGDLYAQNEAEQSAYNFEHADTEFLFRSFDSLETQCAGLVELNLPLPAYERVLQASHTFNLLDARRVIGVTERARYIAKVRGMARHVAQAYAQSREQKGFPGLARSEERADTAEPKPVSSDQEERHGSAALLLEIGTEELPPGSVSALGASLLSELVKELDAAKLLGDEHDGTGESAALEQSNDPQADRVEPKLRWYASPRRIAALIEFVKARTEDVEKIRRGPPVSRAYQEDGSPTDALAGFARSCGVDIDGLQQVEDEKGSFIAYRHTEPGQSADALIGRCVENALSCLPVPKRMRWGDHSIEFVRPVHWIVLRHGARTVPCSVLTVTAGNVSYGHRFLSPDEIVIDDPLRYCELLREKGRVLADSAERKAIIHDQVTELAADAECEVDLDVGLLDEINDLVEWPCAFLGEFDEGFMELPEEVLVQSMHTHQKYFPLWKDGKLMPKFIGVANIDASGEPVRERIVNGNERVLRARLSDAKFFWEQDLKNTLDSLVPKLDRVVFHKDLGSVKEKIERVQSLSEGISELLGLDGETPRRIAELCKADLVSEMVGEFPGLQGTMGRCYALHEGVRQEVAVGIEQHYWPRSAQDRLPETDDGLVVALADRIDSLLGLTAAGEVVKGDRDPFSLRRMATGVLRLLIEPRRDLDLKELFEMSARIYRAAPPAGVASSNVDDAAMSKALALVLDRLRYYYLSKGFSAEEFAAVFELRQTRPLEFDHRIRAVREFQKLPECDSLIAANKRIRNILRKSATPSSPAVDESLLRSAAERELHQRTQALRMVVAPMIDGALHSQALLELASLKEPVDRFFDEVMVMDEDPKLRANRLALVDGVSALFLEVADLSLLKPGGKDGE